MSISGILSSSYGPSQLSGASTLYQQELQQLGKDLQSGSLLTAQSDFALLQKAFSQPTTASATTSNSVAQAFSQLASDLQSGNLPAAQKDFSTLQQDLKPLGPTHPFHPHRHLGGGSDDLTNQNSLLQDLSQVGQNLTSGNLSGAQQAYATLQQQSQQFAFGGEPLSTQSPVSFDA